MSGTAVLLRTPALVGRCRKARARYGAFEFELSGFVCWLSCSVGKGGSDFHTRITEQRHHVQFTGLKLLKGGSGVSHPFLAGKAMWGDSGG